MVRDYSAGLALLQSETSHTIPALEDVLSKHAGVFCEGLGKMKNIQAQIQLNKMLGLDSGQPAQLHLIVNQQ